jgi:hypothetical protein
MFNVYLERFFALNTSARFLIGSGYLITALLSGVSSFLIMENLSPHQVIRYRLLWLSMALIIFLFGLNIMLDLRIWITEVVRVIAKSYGLYEQRHMIQAFVTIGAIIASVMFVILTMNTTSELWLLHCLTIAGIMFFISYMIIFTVSYHPVDQILYKKIAGMSISRLIEISGIIYAWILLAVNYRRYSKNNTAAGVVSTGRYI